MLRGSRGPRSILTRMDMLAFEHHLTSPQGRGATPDGAVTVVASGGACGDTISLSIATDGERITGAGFEANGCGAATAAAPCWRRLGPGRRRSQRSWEA
jgi:NifU-like protein involved in Fe-S cluster formation